MKQNFIFNELVIGCDRFIIPLPEHPKDISLDCCDLNETSENLKLLLSRMYHSKKADFAYFSDVCKLAVSFFDSINNSEYYMTILILNFYFWIDYDTCKARMLHNVPLTLELLSKLVTHFNHQLIRNTVALIGEIFSIFIVDKPKEVKPLKVSVSDYHTLQSNLFQKYQYILPNLPAPFISNQVSTAPSSPHQSLPPALKQVIDLHSEFLVIKDRDYLWYKESLELSKPKLKSSFSSKQDPFSLFIKAFLPSMHDFILQILKLLFMGAPLPSKYSNTPEASPFASTEFVKDQISAIHLEMNRYRESLFFFIARSLLNLMQALKSDDIILEYFKCLVTDANIIPLLLKIIQLKEPHKFIMGITDRQSLDTLEENATQCETTFQATFISLKILYKLSKNSIHRSVILATHKAPDILKKWTLINNQHLTLQCLKTLKQIFPFATRKFRQTNMKLASSIYCLLKFKPFEGFLKFEDVVAKQAEGEAQLSFQKKIIAHRLDKLLGVGHWSGLKQVEEDPELSFYKPSHSASVEDISLYTEQALKQSKDMIKLFMQTNVNHLVQEQNLLAAEDASLWIESFSDLLFTDDIVLEQEQAQVISIVVDEVS